MERVLAVEVLRLLAGEGAYGSQVAAQLDASEVWAAYRDQRHDLFLPAGATAQVPPAPSLPLASSGHVLLYILFRFPDMCPNSYAMGVILVLGSPSIIAGMLHVAGHVSW